MKVIFIALVSLMSISQHKTITLCEFFNPVPKSDPLVQEYYFWIEKLRGKDVADDWRTLTPIKYCEQDEFDGIFYDPVNCYIWIPTSIDRLILLYGSKRKFYS